MTKQNNIDEKRRKRLTWSNGVILGLTFSTFLGFLIKIFYLQQNIEEREKAKINIERNYKEDVVKAARGNLYAANGDILATTVIKYNIFLDFKTLIADSKKKGGFTKEKQNKDIDALSDSLSMMFGKPKKHYKDIFSKEFGKDSGKENQYYSLVKNLDYEEMNRLKNFPILGKKNSKARGMIIEPQYKRILATELIGAGTIGIDDERGTSGFEGAFRQYLSGTDGSRLVQRINGNQWKPIDYTRLKDPIDGEDVYTTLDLRIQDIVHSALEKQLKKSDAQHGSVVVMEVSTGKVRAMVNLQKNESGRYVDSYNFALRDANEPGSTFKTVSLLAAMEDGYIDEKTSVHTGGSWTYHKQRINDTGNYGTLDVIGVMAKSSNIGTAKLITKYYGEKPELFINHLKRWKMFEKLDIELPGAGAPFFYTPEHRRWNKATLASTAYGYSSSISLLQLATFYNGIANKGKMVKPLFIDKRIKDGQILYEAQPEVMVEAMANEKAIKMMTEALVKVVSREGTAKGIFTPNMKLAGKTGTARFDYGKTGVRMKYRASFAGFYPADNPQYTCVVMIHDPQGAYGGGTVAAPVFQEIAGKTFLKTPLNVEEEMLKDKKVDLKKMMAKNHTLQMKNGLMPNITGLSGKSIIPQLENLGYRVEYTGVGKIVEQFPSAGTAIKKDAKIYLKLQQ